MTFGWIGQPVYDLANADFALGVGADFLELAVHAPWEPRRAGSVRSVVAVPLVGVVLVRALPLG